MKRGAAAAALRMLLLLLGQQTLHEGYTPSSGCDVIADTVIIIMIILEQAKKRERERERHRSFCSISVFVQLLFYFYSLFFSHRQTQKNNSAGKKFHAGFCFFFKMTKATVNHKLSYNKEDKSACSSLDTK